MMAVCLDLDLTAADVAGLTSADAVTALLHQMHYPTQARTAIPPDAIGLPDEDGVIQRLEMLSQTPDGLLRVIFAQVRSVTAKTRNDLVKAFGKQTVCDHLLILTQDFDALEFVLIDRPAQRRKGPGAIVTHKPIAKVFVVPRRWPQSMLRILRRLTFTLQDETGQPDGVLQYAKLKSVFDAAHYSGRYFQNRALFADHYLDTRLRDDPAWAADPAPAFHAVTAIMRTARAQTAAMGEAAIRQHVFEPLWKALGFTHQVGKRADDGSPTPDYRLTDSAGHPRTVALTYVWERWLDGPDPSDPDTPDENPGAAVVTLLEQAQADWVIVTNGKLWRLYSRAAHSRSTNFYEVDLEDTLIASGQTDPNEAFRYWWLFFRRQAFEPAEAQTEGCWLDTVAKGSREYAREVEAELKQRVFYEVVPQLATGFLHDRRSRLGLRSTPTDDELEQIRAATLTLLYRILFLLYADSRDLLPVRESAYYNLSLKRLKEEIAAVGGIAQTQLDEKLADNYTRKSTNLYDRMGELFAIMDGVDLQKNRACNVPVYNGGLFRVDTKSQCADPREAKIAQFLLEHKVPDVFLASAVDRLSRVPDAKGIPAFGLAFVDYKSLGVRQLGSIYEGLLEFRLRIAEEDLPPVTGRNRRESTRLSAPGSEPTGVKQGEPYLANDKRERRATGSYYTPEHIVQYIVEHAVGPVLQSKLEALRPGFRDAEKTYHRILQNAQADLHDWWDWKLKQGKTLAKSSTPGKEELREYALDRTLDQHRDLVENLFDIKVLDPAMGSGHFLVEAVDYITDELLHFLNAFPVNPVVAAMARARRSILQSLEDQGIETDSTWEKRLTNVHLIKRHVLKRCIYGVDLNPLATELSKVSLWLDAFTIGAPLSFLDHHVRVGNSLIGATVEQAQAALEADQMTLFGSRFAGLKLAAIGMTAIAAMPDTTADQVKLSQLEYRRASGALAPFKRILDAYLLQWFMPEEIVEQVNKPKKTLHKEKEVKLTRKERRTASQIALDFLKAPESRPFLDATTDQQIEAALDSLPQPDRAVAEAVLKTGDERHFFHWELEFPEAFYAPREGTKQAVERMENPGFDAVIGNPPWGSASELLNLVGPTAFPEADDDYAECFVLLAVRSIRVGGHIGQVLPDTVLGPAKSRTQGSMLRTVSTTWVWNLGPDWFTSDVRMSAILWGARRLATPPEEYTFQSCILPIEVRRACILGVLKLSDAILSNCRTVVSKECFAGADVAIPLFGTQPAVELFSRVFSEAPSLGDVCEHGRGVELNKAGLVFRCPECGKWDAPPKQETSGEWRYKECSHCGHSYRPSNSVEKRILVSDVRGKTGDWCPFVDGDSVRRYGTSLSSWIDVSANGVNYKGADLYRSPCILIRQAGIGINAMLSTNSAYCPQSIYVYRVLPEFRTKGWDESVLLSLLCSRIFHLQVFMSFGEIDSTRAFAKLTHTRLARLRLASADALSSKELLAKLRKSVDNLCCNGGHESVTDDWLIEACWSRLLGLARDDFQIILRNFARVHHNETLELLFPGGVKDRERHWLDMWSSAMTAAGAQGV